MLLENKIKQFLNDHTYINGRYVNKSVAINVNPGIPCIISENAIINELTINAKEMNSIDYIHALDVYISNVCNCVICKKCFRITLFNHFLDFQASEADLNAFL